MSHEHNHNNEVSWGRRLAATMVMNLIIPIVQIYGGIIAGSMALISDAIHNLSDFVSVFVSYLALKMGGRGPDYKQTFGYKRIEVFAAVFNVALLFGAGFYIAIEAWQRLQHPQPIQAKIVIAIAAAAFIANAASTILLMAGAKANLNIRSAFIHMLTDTLMSLGIVALGILWLYLPWYWLDPVFSWIIVAMIFYSGWGILKEAFFIFMNATPPGIDLTDIQRKIEALEGVKELHHLHVWNLSSEGIALAAHIVADDQMLCEVDKLADRIREVLSHQFGIDHPTLQFETKPYEATGLLCCPTNGRNGKTAM